MLRQILLLLFLVAHARAAGLLARFTQDAATDVISLPNAALYVEPGRAPTGALEPGEYTVELSGSVSVDLRAQYSFQVQTSGHCELLVNGNLILAVSSPGVSELSKPVRLSKGTNPILAKLRAAPGKPLQFVLFWKSRNLPLPVPIPSSALSFDERDPDLLAAAERRAGADAYVQFRCGKCHTETMRELDSPNLANAGARLRRDWMAEWIADPKNVRSDAHMPRLVAPDEASAIADFLATLGTPAEAEQIGDPASGEKLFSALQCAKCHTDEPGRARLMQVRQKFQPGALATYLRNPQAHYGFNRMPNFHLSAEEAASLALWLVENSTPARPTGPSNRDPARGKQLFAMKGCAQCHALPEIARADARPILELHSGCLYPRNFTTPSFNFPDGTRSALVRFLSESISRSNTRPIALRSSIEYALAETTALNCGQCHNSADGVIRLEALGGKLRPEWMEAFLHGDIAVKPRPWLPARMPAFPAYATGLAQGLAALHGLPPQTTAEDPLDSALAKTGAKLVSSAGGFSCVACHAVGAHGSASVVESPGLNLALSAQRLQKSFFHRWVMNPLALDPATKMPVYFDEGGRSQLLDILDGDGEKQIEAIWQYLRFGPEMPAPPAP